MKVPSKDYARQYRAIWDEVESALRQVFSGDQPVLGEALARFERELAHYHDTAHAVGVGSGTDALVLLLRALGIGPGDEVVTASHTFSGVLSALLLAGATPKLAAVDDRGLLDPEAAAAAITPRTAAILAVHLYGHPADLDALGALASARGLLLLEDAAQAHGARWRGRPVGSFGRAAILSFHPSKNLGAFGDGGAVLTGDGELAARLRIDRNLGKDGKYSFAAVAPNSKLDTLQAALLSVKLRHLDDWIDRRRALAARYRDRLHGTGDLRLPDEDPRARHAYHLYVVRTEQREALRGFLAEHGVKAGLHYPVAAPAQPALAPHFGHREFPRAEQWARTVLTLPLSHELEDAEVDHVCDRVCAFFAG